MRGKRQGYTLFEIVMVVAILVAVTSISVPLISSMMGDGKASAAADELRTRWSQSRSKAMSEGRSYRFAYQENSGKFKIAPDSPEFWDEGGASVDDSDEKAWVLEAELPGATHFATAAASEGGPSTTSSGSSSGAWTRAASFQSDGSAKIFRSDGTSTADGEFAVTINSPGSQTMTLKLRGNTAAVSTHEGNRP